MQCGLHLYQRAIPLPLVQVAKIRDIADLQGLASRPPICPPSRQSAMGKSSDLKAIEVHSAGRFPGQLAAQGKRPRGSQEQITIDKTSVSAYTRCQSKARSSSALIGAFFISKHTFSNTHVCNSLKLRDLRTPVFCILLTRAESATCTLFRKTTGVYPSRFERERQLRARFCRAMLQRARCGLTEPSPRQLPRRSRQRRGRPPFIPRQPTNPTTGLG
jgi:hypothetical protein